MNSSIILCTLNSRYSHSSFGLRYLYANLGELKSQAKIIEFTINENADDIALGLLQLSPKLIGFGIYIWNTRQTLAVIALIKRLRPDIKIVLGGPEVSFEGSEQEICGLADLVIQGESDLAFADLCRSFIHTATWPSEKFLRPSIPELPSLAWPYECYTQEDISNRVIYVEASRGCPYQCSYCLSSLDKKVRAFDTDRFLNEIKSLIERGARSFKFVDRTFNLKTETSVSILRFFYEEMERLGEKIFLHFEMIPDRLPDELKHWIKLFPPASLQFEIGIQTMDDSVSQAVNRRQNLKKAAENFRFLVEETAVHIHADLIVGLPNETQESFARGFDDLLALKPHEIQVGMLKRLRGTPLTYSEKKYSLVFDPAPPYRILQTANWSFASLQKMSYFSRYWDLIANSGNFKRTLPYLLRGPSAFARFLQLTEFLMNHYGRRHQISLMNLFVGIWQFAQSEQTHSELELLLIQDYSQSGRRDIRPLQNKFGLRPQSAVLTQRTHQRALIRQERHLPERIGRNQ